MAAATAGGDVVGQQPLEDLNGTVDDVRGCLPRYYDLPGVHVYSLRPTSHPILLTQKI